MEGGRIFKMLLLFMLMNCSLSLNDCFSLACVVFDISETGLAKPNLKQIRTIKSQIV